MKDYSTKAVYVGSKLPMLSGMTGEIVSRSSFDGVSLVTLYYKEIDKKFTVQEVNIEPA